MNFRRNIFFTTLCTLLISLAIPVPLLTSGGDNPVEGIDIIIKYADGTAPFTPRELMAVNGLKGTAKPALIGNIAASYVSEMTDGATRQRRLGTGAVQGIRRRLVP